MIAIGASAVSLVCLPVAGVPAPPAWSWLAASAIIHLLYFAALIESYRTGDLGQVYPIARGSAPLMTAIVSAAFVGEHLNLLGWIGIVTLTAGVLLLSTRGGRDIVQRDRRAVGYALLTALTICAYSVTDGIGVRLSRNPLAYVQWLFVANAIVLVPYALWRDRSGVTVAMRRFWLRGLAGGVAGEVALLSQRNAAKAEQYFERALAIARQQQAKSWELRAAMRMARLWRDQGKRDEARDLLAPVYGWFTEGFDTRDLKDAKALLGELAA